MNKDKALLAAKEWIALLNGSNDKLFDYEPDKKEEIITRQLKYLSQFITKSEMDKIFHDTTGMISYPNLYSDYSYNDDDLPF